jgi:hypothetical protein
MRYLYESQLFEQDNASDVLNEAAAAVLEHHGSGPLYRDLQTLAAEITLAKARASVRYSIAWSLRCTTYSVGSTTSTPGRLADAAEGYKR